MAHDDPQTLLREAIQAAQQGNHTAARIMLEQVIAGDSENELAWIWLATVAESNAQRRTYLARVLEINPRNARARQALDALQAPGSTPPRSAGSRKTAALQETPRHQARRGSSPLFLAAAILAVAMIAAGALLLKNALSDGNERVQSAPTATIVAAVPGAPASPTPRNLRPSTTPLPTSRLAEGTQEALPPTWTPTATWTPSPEPQPTVVPSLDSYTLLVSRQAADDSWNLVTMRADGTRSETLTFELPADLANNASLEWIGIFDAAYSPDAQQIAAVGWLRQEAADGNPENAVDYRELFTGPAAGGTLRQITSMRTGELGDLAWSPDGSQILFAANAEGDSDIYAVASGRSEPRRLTDNSSEDRYPAWSPDGQYVAFASDLAGPGAFEIWRMPVGGGEPEQLTEAENSSFSPTYSPDGNWIVFISDRGGDSDLYRMNADGTGERILTTNDDADALDPAWSPDGEWIIYSSNLDSEFYQLVAIHPDGTGLQRLTNGRANYRYVHWMPAR